MEVSRQREERERKRKRMKCGRRESSQTLNAFSVSFPDSGLMIFHLSTLVSLTACVSYFILLSHLSLASHVFLLPPSSIAAASWAPFAFCFSRFSHQTRLSPHLSSHNTLTHISHQATRHVIRERERERGDCARLLLEQRAALPHNE